MRSVALKDIAALFEGQIDCIVSGDSVQPVRYRVSDAGFVDPAIVKVGAFAGGVRLRLKTDSTVIHLELAQIRAHIPGREWWTTDYELFINGKQIRDVPSIGGAQIMLGGAITGDPHTVVVLNDLPVGDKNIELWMPPTVIVSVKALRIDNGAQLAPWPDTRRRILFHGSSITQAVDANGGTRTWPGIASSRANACHVNLGWAGACLISGFAGRILRDDPAVAIVLELGANIWENGLLKERTILDSAHSLLAIIREKHLDTPIAVVSPIAFSRGDDASNDGGVPLGRTRELLETVVATRRKTGDINVHYLSGILLSGSGDLHNLPDGIHPDATGNRLMGERFFEQMLAPGKPLAPG